MKIAFVTDGLFPDKIGGIQKYSTELIRHLAMQGSVIHVYTQMPCPRAEQELGAISNIVFHTVKFRSPGSLPGKYLRANNFFSKAVFKHIALHNPVDVVYAQGFTGYYGLVRKFRGSYPIPVFINLHGLEMFQPARGIKALLIQRYFKLYVRRMLRKSMFAVALGKALANIMHRVQPRTEISIIPNGISDEWFQYFNELSTPNTVRKFLFVGRYEWRKGMDTLKEALKLLSETEQEWTMEFIGHIPESEKLSDSRLIYHGQLSDAGQLADIYKQADILVCPSYSEGMPTVVLEAMAAGKAIIATQVGATAELVSAENGFLIRPFDAKTLYQSMLSCIKMPSNELQKLQSESRRLAMEKFNWHHIASLHLEAFSQRIQ